MKVTTYHKKVTKEPKLPIMTFLPKWQTKSLDEGQSPPQEPEEGPRSGLYLLGFLCFSEFMTSIPAEQFDCFFSKKFLTFVQTARLQRSLQYKTKSYQLSLYRQL